VLALQQPTNRGKYTQQHQSRHNLSQHFILHLLRLPIICVLLNALDCANAEQPQGVVFVLCMQRDDNMLGLQQAATHACAQFLHRTSHTVLYHSVLAGPGQCTSCTAPVTAAATATATATAKMPVHLGICFTTLEPQKPRRLFMGCSAKV
jgi:hypothetical protein